MRDKNIFLSLNFIKKIVYTCLFTTCFPLNAALLKDATQTAIDTQSWRLDPGRHALTYAPSYAVLPHFAFSSVVALQQSGPSIRVSSSTERTLRILAGHRTELTLGGAVGLFDHFETGFTLPVVLYQQGQLPGLLLGNTASTGIGDIGFYGKWLAYSHTSFPLHVSLFVPFTVPSGNKNAFMGFGTFTTEPQIIVASGWKNISFNMAWGYALIPQRTLFTSYTNPMVTTHVSAFYQHPTKKWRAGVEWHLASNPAHYMDDLHTKSSLLGSGEYRINDTWGVFASAGAGMFSALGTQSYHILSGVSFYTDRWSDFDHDGFNNRSDRCIQEAEDFDQFEDEDGCPDRDNDKDSVVDTQDQCPMQPEDFDQYEDSDGCPEEDNDKDGVSDTKDACPLVAGKLQDNPTKPGCPKEEKPEVQITETSIEVRMQSLVFFKHGYMRVSRGFHILDAIAEAIKKNPDILKIRIEGYADETGPESLNLHVSQRRAESVRDHLISRGIDPSRLEAKGMGEGSPRDPSAKNKQSQENRRVELVIVQKTPVERP